MRASSSPEPLENRIAPAAVFTYIDLDGDDVTITTSRGLAADLAAPGVLTFSSADATAPRQLQLIDLSADPDFNLTDLKVTATRNAARGGDGLADVGFVNAQGRDLGSVTIDGDLGRIVAGVSDLAPTPAVKLLSVRSMGELGASTQTSGGTLVSTFAGPLQTLNVAGNLRDVDLSTTGAHLGSVDIGGSMLGAKITSDGDIASVKIGGSIVGGAAANTGRILAGGKIGGVTIGGSLVGDTFAGTGVLDAGGDLGKVLIKGDLRGGAGADSGRLHAGGTMPSVTVNGSIFGGGDNSGGIYAVGQLGAVALDGSAVGGAGSKSGAIRSENGGITSLKMKGSLTGGAGANSASVQAGGAIGSLTIGGSLRAGSGPSTASVFATGSSGAFTIGGSLVGFQGTGTQGFDGALLEGETIKSVTIKGSILGGTATFSGAVNASFGQVGPVIVYGSVIGGAGLSSGSIIGEGIGKTSIGGDLRGGSGPDSGTVRAFSDTIAGINVKGSVFSGSVPRSGYIAAYTGLPSVVIEGNLVGTAAFPVVIAADFNTTPGGTAITKVLVAGRAEFAEILAGYDVGGLTGFIADSADAKVGTVTVNGDWIASSIAAGVQRGADGKFGTDDDTANPLNPAPPSPLPAGAKLADYSSRISTVTIKGQALGTVGGTDAFGIVAESVDAVKVGAFSETLKLTTVDAVPLGATGDFIVREDVAPGGPSVALPVFADTTGLQRGTASLVTFTDVDGDKVTVQFTKPIFDPGLISLVAAGNGYQLQSLTIPSVAGNDGVGITITATLQDVNADGILDGDGFVNVGLLSAANVSLGAVKIAGDLGKIVAGKTDASVNAVASLDVRSMGIFGKSTQAAGGDLLSALSGSVPLLKTGGDILNAEIAVTGVVVGTKPNSGFITTLTVGGSLRGGDATTGLGRISATGSIGALSVKGDVLGGSADQSGRISAFSAKTVIVSGSIIGGDGKESGKVIGGFTSASVKHDVRGGLGEGSGSIASDFSLGTVTITGSVVGGGGKESGSVLAKGSFGRITSVALGGDLRGGAGEESGKVQVALRLNSVGILQSLLGGAGLRSGLVLVGGDFRFSTSATIGGDVIGGGGEGSGSLGTVSGDGSMGNLKLGGVAIKGSIIGGATKSAHIAAQTILKLTIGGNLIGGVGSSATVEAFNRVNGITIGGSLLGGAGTSGAIVAGSLDSLTVTHDIRGGAGDQSGSVTTGGASKVTINGSVESGAGQRSGSIGVNGNLGSLAILGSVTGTAASPAYVFARGADAKSTPLALTTLSIGGSAEYLKVLGGYNDLTEPRNSRQISAPSPSAARGARATSSRG